MLHWDISYGNVLWLSCGRWRAQVQAGVRYAAQNPYSYVHANVLGHVTLLEAVVTQMPIPAMVYASSSSVYGLNTKQPFSEGDRVDNPASLYAATKRVRSPLREPLPSRLPSVLAATCRDTAHFSRLINHTFALRCDSVCREDTCHADTWHDDMCLAACRT